MNPALLRARQIKALYQREITALNRNPHLDADSRRDQAERLWQQANQRMSRLRESVASDFESFSADDRALFDPPRRPAYLEPVE